MPELRVYAWAINVIFKDKHKGGKVQTQKSTNEHNSYWVK